MNVYKKITNAYISCFSKETTPWSFPLLTATNYSTGRKYNGINLFLLSCLQVEKAISFTQCQQHKMKIPAGEKGIPMIRWNKVEGKSKPSIYYVFSTTKLSATKTMAASKTPNPVELEKLLTCILDSLALNFEFSQALPGFDGYTNTIKLPASSIELSNVIELAFATALAVQQEKALAINPPKATMTMNDANRFVLTAHLTAQMLCSAFNVLPESRFHTGTQNLWIPLLKQDPAMLIQAAASAQKIFDFMYTGLTPAETKAITEQAVS